MSQAWHKRRERLLTTQEARAQLWRASEYQVGDLDGQQVIEAAPEASWERFSPFDYYKPTGKTRTVEAGPHLTFLKLKNLWKEQPQLPREALSDSEDFRKAYFELLDQANLFPEVLKRVRGFHKEIASFARKYGLLGAFYEDFQPDPLLPKAKAWVAPEAVISEGGRLRLVDPATEGKELLIKVLEPTGIFSAGHNRHNRLPDSFERRAAYESMALPSETKFAFKSLHVDRTEWPSAPRQFVPWEEIKRYFGALLILDERSSNGVSVLCTREPLRRWESSFGFFPSRKAESGNLELDYSSYHFLNSYLEDISPHALIGEDGSLVRSWRYSNLLQVMALMLFWDLTGGNTIKKCQRRGCPYYFRIGSQSGSKYCSKKCANLASTRIGRGQEP